MADTEYNYGDWHDKWTWWNCRSLRVGIDLIFCPWEWHVKAKEHDYNDCTSWQSWVQFGPILLSIAAGIGNVSSESRWRAWFGLSDDEAYQRSANIQARAAKKALTNG